MNRHAPAVLEALSKTLCAIPDDAALQLSGGLDSAILHALRPFGDCYCCSWPELDNWSAAKLALGRHGKLHPVTFSREQMLEEALPHVAQITRGRGTWSQCCQWYLDRAIAKDGHKAVVNGECADELFGGYARYRILWWLDRMRADLHLEEYQGFVDDVVGTRTENLRRCCRNGDLDLGPFRTTPLVRLAMGYDGMQPLSSLLTLEDAIARAHGLEHLHPYAALRSLADELDPDELIDVTESKVILRDVARLAGVHPGIIHEQTKRGLVVPPSWAPKGSAKWSRGWFEAEMAAAWERIARSS